MATKDKLINLEDLKAVRDHDMAIVDNKANSTGYYPDLIAGTADNLLSSSYQTDKTPYLLRRTPYGAREKGSIVGGSVVWNQLCNSADSVTVTNGHKYFMKKGTAYSIGASTGTAITGLTSGSDMVIDLTLMFGSTIADYIYTQEQASAGAGVALAKAWAGIVNDYYPYDAGSIKSVGGLTAHKMTDGNGDIIGEYPLDSTLTLRGLPKLDEGSLYYDGDVYEGNKTGTITYNAVDMGTLPWFANGTSGGYYEYAVSIEDKAIGQYNVFCDIFPTAVGVGQPNAIRGRSSTTTISVLVAESSLEAFVSSVSGHKLCYELSSPMTQESGGAVTVRYAVTYLGSLNWTYSNSADNPYFYSSNIPTKTGGNWNILCPKYALSSSGATTGMQDKEIKGHATSKAVFIKDSAYTDAETFKASLAGVLLLYELDTPFTISASPYTELQICDPNGTEEWVGASMPVGHDTKYYADLKGKIEDIPDAPSADGTYTLKVTVSGGVATYSWE